MDALEVLIQFLKHAGLSTAQIASKKHFGDSWEIGTSAIVVTLDGGDPQLYLPMQRIRIEVRCFATDQYAAQRLMGEVETVCRAVQRDTQTVTGGTALIYYVQPVSGISLLFDPDTQMDFTLLFFEAAISLSSVE